MDLHKLIQTHLLRRSLLSYALWPLGFLYSELQKQNRKKWSKNAYQAPCRIISVGNLVSGGGGKTPLTIALAKLLQEKGLQVAVSHRGYKGAFENQPTVISDGNGLLFSAAEAGDEACLIASSLPKTPVVVGRKRQQAIKLLLKSFPATELIILDDALQHTRVKRDLDLVSFSADIGIGNGFVLPAGYLREPLSALNKDSLAIVYSSEPLITLPSWVSRLQDQGLTVLYSQAQPHSYCDAFGNSYPLESLKGKRLVLVSGIAAPKSFEKTVLSLQLRFSKHYAYPDHYSFSNSKLETELCREMPEYLLCTQKDIMKLAAHPKLAPKLRAIVLDYRFADPEQLWQIISARIQ